MILTYFSDPHKLHKHKQIKFWAFNAQTNFKSSLQIVGSIKETYLLKMENSNSKQKTANLEKKIEEKQPTSYQEWIQQAQVARNANWKLNVAIHESDDTKEPPKFDKVFK